MKGFSDKDRPLAYLYITCSETGNFRLQSDEHEGVC